MARPPGPKIDRQAWLAVPFFVGLGILLLALDAGTVLAWTCIGLGLICLVALLAMHFGWYRPPRSEPRPRTDAGDVPLGDRPARIPRPSRVSGLSQDGVRRVDELVAVLARTGVFAPEVPDPAILHAAVADRGEPITASDVLLALGEVSYWHPGVDPTRYTTWLAHHETHVEQWEDNLVEQAEDLARLAGGTVPVEVAEVHQEFAGDGSRRIPTRIHLVVAGAPLTLTYQGTPKGLSTVLHVELARALRAAGAPRRIAWLWGDDCLLAGLPDQDLTTLNRALGLTDDGWEWVDETEPYAAG